MRDFAPRRAAARKPVIVRIDEPTRLVCFALGLAVIAVVVRLITIW